VSKKKSWVVSIVMFLVFLTHGSLVYSASHEIMTKPLKGLTAISVLVEKLNADIKDKTGLTEKQIETDVELKLRMAGIKVVSLGESLNIPGMPYLYVNLSIFRHSSGLFFAYSIYIALIENVYLERNSAINVSAQTWFKGEIGVIGESQVSSIRNNIIKDTVDIFINDYLSANPKGGK